MTSTLFVVVKEVNEAEVGVGIVTVVVVDAEDSIAVVETLIDVAHEDLVDHQ